MGIRILTRSFLVVVLVFGRALANHAQGVPGTGGATRRAIPAALNWLARHQSKDGSWSLSKFDTQCIDGKCSGAGRVDSDVAATAMGLLPFLAAGQTHQSLGPYRINVRTSLTWLIAQQKPGTGEIATQPGQVPYAHGLATLALCEAYAMTADAKIGKAAQSAIDFIQATQDKQAGSWHVRPGDAGDMALVGWHVMALKSGTRARLNVEPSSFSGVQKYLTSVAGGNQHGALFGDQPGASPTPALTSVGLLGRQYLGTAADDPGLAKGAKYLVQNLPDEKGPRNIFYWYCATQVLHNMQGDDWDTWNRKARRTLINLQERKGCAAGSWDPDKPVVDAWGQEVGRVMTTSLSCMMLETYHRYLQLFEVRIGEEQTPPQTAN